MPNRAMELEEMEELLIRLPVGRLGVCRDGKPYVVPIHYLYQQGRMYFHSKRTGLKMDYLLANPLVCFETDELVSVVKASLACQFTAEYRSVIVHGMVRFVEDAEEKRIIAGKLIEKYAGDARFEPASREKLEEVAIVEIAIRHMTGKINMRNI